MWAPKLCAWHHLKLTPHSVCCKVGDLFDLFNIF